MTASDSTKDVVYMSQLTTIPDECKLLIVYEARVCTKIDRLTLASLLYLCKIFNTFMIKNKARIIEHYTKQSMRGSIILYTFCGKLHRESRGDTLPALIYPGIYM